MKTLTEHWDEIFHNTEHQQLGWYEKNFSQTLKFLDQIPNWENKTLIVPGIGASQLLDVLMGTNAKLVLNDLSPKAIEKAKLRHPDAENRIHWICQDISQPLPIEPDSIDIWLDRAVLHFLTDALSIQGYFRNLKTVLKPGGYAIFAEFSKTGATKCAGLNVKRYDAQDLQVELSTFKLIHSEDYIYVNPKGDDRPYIYALFQENDS